MPPLHHNTLDYDTLYLKLIIFSTDEKKKKSQEAFSRLLLTRMMTEQQKYITFNKNAYFPLTSLWLRSEKQFCFNFTPIGYLLVSN